MEISKTGIKGFDKLVRGGFLEGTSILLTGSPGTGKTIFGLSYLYNGCKKYNEKGLLVTFEEREDNLHRQANKFNWDLAKIQDEGRLFISCIPASAIERNTVDSITRTIKRNNIKRLVIDSLSTLAMNTPTLDKGTRTIEDLSIKKFIYGFLHTISQTKVTSIVISHVHSDQSLSIDGVSEFICDGIIKIKFQPMGGRYSRALSLEKMRSINNDEDLHPLEINNKGITVYDL